MQGFAAVLQHLSPESGTAAREPKLEISECFKEFSVGINGVHAFVRLLASIKIHLTKQFVDALRLASYPS